MKRKIPAIPARAKELINDLGQLFPTRAGMLIAELSSANMDGKKIPLWRQQQIESFVKMLTLSAFDLERAYREKRITTLAWATRNLLELSIWVDYCNLSLENAKQFHDDRMKDLYGLANAIQGSVEIESGSKDSTLDHTINDLQQFARSKGIVRLANDFRRVSDAANVLGRGPAFRSSNKLLSKLAHPTAWATHTVASVEADEGFRLMFLGDGVELAINALIAVRKIIREHYPQIAMTREEALVRIPPSMT